MQTFWTITTTVLGSGACAALFSALLQWWSNRREREWSSFNEQLSKLYGPLFFFTSRNESLFRLYDDYHKAYDTEYGGKKFAPEAHDRAMKEAKALLEEANSYIRTEVKENNQKVIGLLQGNWHLVDLDDLELFSTFQVDVSRLQRTDDGTFAHTSFVTHQHIGPISYMRPEMITRVKEKFMSKRGRLEQLTARRKSRPRRG